MHCVSLGLTNTECIPQKPASFEGVCCLVCLIGALLP